MDQGVDPRWKSIWKLEVPGAVKFFLGKASNNLLTTKVNLFKKKITENHQYPICCEEEETILHVLWLCPTTRDV